MTIIHRSTEVPFRARLHRAAKARQREHPARPIPPARVGSAWRNLILRAATWLRVHLRDPAPAPPPPARPTPAQRGRDLFYNDEQKEIRGMKRATRKAI